MEISFPLSDLIEWIKSLLQPIFGDQLPLWIIHTIAWVTLLAVVLFVFWFFLWIISKIKRLIQEDFLPEQDLNRYPGWFISRFNYRRAYLNHLIYYHRNFDVKGLTTQNIYTLELEQVFVELSITPRTLHQASTDPIRSLPAELKGVRSIWNFLNAPMLQDQQLAVIGAPGSGKTTLLKYIVLTLATKRKKYRRRVNTLSRLPILLFLRDYATAIDKNATYSLVQAIEEGLRSKRGPEPPAMYFANQLRANRCLILFDGLDEVADAQKRKQVAQWVENQMLAYPGNRFIITSRPNGYRTNPLSNVILLEVQPFDQKQINQFIRNWYRANEIMSTQKDDSGVRILAEEGAEDLLRRLRTMPTLAALAVNPLLLTMIATVHRYRSSLPGRRVELYAEVCEVFFGKRRQAIGLELDLTPGQKQRVLRPLAYYMMVTKKREIGIDEAIKAIIPPLRLVTGKSNKQIATNFLKTIEADSGLFLEREAGEYSFAHLAFQEYLASVHIIEERLVKQLATRVNNSWWHETCRLYGAQADATPIIAACLADEPPPLQALILAIECNDEAREIEPYFREQLERILNDEVEDSDPERRRLVATALLELRLRRMVRVTNTMFVDPTYITHAEYQLFLDEMRVQGDFYQPDHWLQPQFPSGQGKSAIVGIRSNDAIAFCRWLSQRSEEGWQFSLPQAGELMAYGSSLNTINSNPVGYWVYSGKEITFEGDHTYLSSGILLKQYYILDRDYDPDFTTELIDRLKLKLPFSPKVDPTYILDYSLNHIIEFTRSLDLDLTYNFDTSNSIDSKLIHNLELSLNHALHLARDRKRIPHQDHNDIRRALYRYIRLVAMLTASKLQEILETTKKERSLWNSETAFARETQGWLDGVLQIYVDFSMLEARIDGDLPAIEGLRIVKKRIDSKTDLYKNNS